MNQEVFSRLFTRCQQANIGRTIWNQKHTEKGVVISISNRYCAACGHDHECYIVKWDDGAKTKPCTAGVKAVGDELQIE